MVRRICGEPWPRVVAKSAVVLVAGTIAEALSFFVSLNAALWLG